MNPTYNGCFGPTLYLWATICFPKKITLRIQIYPKNPHNNLGRWDFSTINPMRNPKSIPFSSDFTDQFADTLLYREMNPLWMYLQMEKYQFHPTYSEKITGCPFCFYLEPLGAISMVVYNSWATTTKETLHASHKSAWLKKIGICMAFRNPYHEG